MFTRRNTGALPIATGGEATLDRNGINQEAASENTQRSHQFSGWEENSVTLTKFTGKDTLFPALRHPLDCPFPLGFDSSKKAKPPAEPKEVLRPWALLVPRTQQGPVDVRLLCAVQPGCTEGLPWVPPTVDQK